MRDDEPESIDDYAARVKRRNAMAYADVKAKLEADPMTAALFEARMPYVEMVANILPKNPPGFRIVKKDRK